MTSAPTQHNATVTTNESFRDRFHAIRQLTVELTAGLSPEDCVVQSMPDASPVKWHLAHTTWFFETFLLRPGLPGYREFHPKFNYLFNSYYNAVGSRHPRPQRGLLTRPSLMEVLDYRESIDQAMESFLERSLSEKEQAVLETGLHHEQQHQELLLTDVKHLLAQNPLNPALIAPPPKPAGKSVPSLEWSALEHGLVEGGFSGDGFCYDNETPQHQCFLHPCEIATRLITNGEYLEFIDNGGYRRPELWLSDGWDAAQNAGWQAPLYWQSVDGEWFQQTLFGEQNLIEEEPVCHISFYEADAYARWAGARLPTETEWETLAKTVPIEGNFVESGRFHPEVLQRENDGLQQVYGDVWEWTQSPYSPYPGYEPPAGALGEYNGKFMCNQFVLRGGSCATSQSHIRPTYRNFFKPEARWQFSGLRLARDV